MADLKKIITAKLKLGRPKIAFGLLDRFPAVEDCIRKNSEHADITLVSKQEIPGFVTAVSENPEQKIIDMLLAGEVDGIIRGTVDDFSAFHYFCEKTGFKKHECIVPAVLETPQGLVFFLGSASNPEGWELEEKKRTVKGIAEFMRSFGLVPKIGLFSGVRPASVGKNPKIDQTWYNAEELTKYCNELGYTAKNYNIEFNTAIEDGANLIEPVNGMVGNQIFRAVLICGGRVLICPRVNVGYVYEDNSRTEKDYEWHIKYATAWANTKKAENKS